MHESDDSDDRTDDGTERTGVSFGMKFLQNVVHWLDSHNTNVEYSSSVKTGLDDEARSRRGDESGRNRRTRRPAETNRRRLKRRYTVDHLTTTRREDDELVVSIDMPSIDPDDLIVGLSGGDLVVTVDGRPIERVPLDSPDAKATRARYNNGILEVRLQTAGGSTDE